MASEFEKRKAVFRDAIIHDCELRSSARVVGYKIADLINSKSGDSWPSQEYLSNQLGLSIRTVGAAVGVLVERGWFSTEMDGRGLRYVPKYERAAQTPAKPAGVHTGGYSHDTGKSCRTTPARKGPLSSNDDPKNNPRRRCEELGPFEGAASNDRSRRERMLTLADQSSVMTEQARHGGAPCFVFENSEPWHAWTEYRKRNGLAGAMPSRQCMVGGRWRTGWDAPTLYPPGYRREGAA